MNFFHTDAFEAPFRCNGGKISIKYLKLLMHLFLRMKMTHAPLRPIK